jgi:long-subunit acyl-CoA synthetase (AMP-forming)
MDARIDRLAETLAGRRFRVMGLYADNGEDWALADLAAERAGVTLVPLPAFFTQEQMRHAAAATGMDALYCEAPAIAQALGFHPVDGGSSLFRRDSAPVSLPSGTAKVTFTSGTTGAPKGVCLSAAGQQAVARSIAQAIAGLGIERHLCLLPLAVLLENVAGVRAALVAGARFIAPPLAQVGLTGATGFDPRACLGAIERADAQSAIVLPHMLLMLAAALEAGTPRPKSLRFVAVGGARVSPELIARARAAGLPVHEGYGLSECASVVALNTPGADRPGSVGKPLAHARVRIADDGEILVSSGAFLGYAGEPAWKGEWFHTGDLGRLDPNGFLYVEGRRRNVLITSFGRNVAPEWPEAELLAGGALAQAAVFGEGRPSLCAVVVAPAAVSDAAIAAQVGAANERLPDYARVAHWVRAAAPFGPHNGLATPNGRIRREAVWQLYREQLDAV